MHCASPTCRCDLKIIETIKTKLDGENLKKFKGSCFGRLLKMNQLRFQGQVIVHLLAHLDRITSKGKLIFRINNDVAEFVPNEFFLMTGLKFGTEQPSAQNSTIQREVFSGQRRITFFDLSCAFESHNIQSKGAGEVTLKLALLCFLYGVLLVCERSSNVLDIRFLHLADDLDMFNSFPWGVPAFEALRSSVLVADGRLQSAVQKNGRCVFDMCGFTFALQAWAYEIEPLPEEWLQLDQQIQLPSLNGDAAAKSRNRRNQKQLDGCHGTASDENHSDKQDSFDLDQPSTDVRRLVILLKAVCGKLDIPVPGFKCDSNPHRSANGDGIVEMDHLLNEYDSREATMKHEPARADSAKTIMDREVINGDSAHKTIDHGLAKADFADNTLDCEVTGGDFAQKMMDREVAKADSAEQTLYRELARDGSAGKNMGREVENNLLHSSEETPSNVNSDNMNPERPSVPDRATPVEVVSPASTVQNKDDAVVDVVSPEETPTLERRDEKDSASPVGFPKRSKDKNDDTPVIRSTKRARTPFSIITSLDYVVDQPRRIPFNPNSVCSDQMIKEFDEWYHKNLTIKHGSEVQVQVQFAQEKSLSTRWFKPLYDQRGWLKDKPKLLSNDGGFFTQYVEGKLPEQSGMVWSVVDNVYGVANIEKH
ncbi:hypothetical protein C2S53_003116 [Perilla frutescens var. hirtella]|uniref:DUF1985 domain-containing protein n=1 Tax=Perilla frutescens var. hirtella TaxID=608512 RepID=A0AAD4JNW4_PERFH|nr:hypothetical protein C2S53_003116 [Perilla frutescens var. hirtella]